MIVDATKISYFKDPERSTYDQPKAKKRKKYEKDLGVIIDESLSARQKRKKIV